MMLKILLKKEIQNAFAQKKFIYMMIGMSVFLPFLIPMFDTNQFIEKIIPASFFACFIPNYIALNCSSQLVVNSYLEEVKSNISTVFLNKKIKKPLYYFTKTIIPATTGFICGIVSSAVFHFVNAPISMNDFLVIIIANLVWSIIPSLVTLLLTTFCIEDEVMLNTLMLFTNLAVYATIVFLKNPLENINVHLIYAIITGILLLIITDCLIRNNSTKLEVNDDGQHF